MDTIWITEGEIGSTAQFYTTAGSHAFWPTSNNIDGSSLPDTTQQHLMTHCPGCPSTEDGALGQDGFMVSLMSKRSYDQMPKASIMEARSGRCHGLLVRSQALVDLSQKVEKIRIIALEKNCGNIDLWHSKYLQMHTCAIKLFSLYTGITIDGLDNLVFFNIPLWLLFNTFIYVNTFLINIYLLTYTTTKCNLPFVVHLSNACS